MANIIKRISYSSVPGGGSSVASRYTQSFNAGSFTLNSPNYELSVLAITHTKGTTPNVTVYYDNGVTFEEVETVITINILGDVIISVNEIPDNRFTGKLIII